MQISENPRSKEILPIIYPTYFLLSILQSLGALVFILRVESEKGSHLLLGLSSTRLVIALLFLFITLLSATLFAEIRLKPERYHQRLQLLNRFLNKRTAWGIIMILIGGLFLLGGYFISSIPDITEPFTRGIFNRLLPIVVWTTGMSAQTFIALLILRHGTDLFKFRPRGATFYLSSLILGGIFVTWSLIMREIYVSESQLTGWNNMGVPVIETQLFIAWVAGMAMFAICALVNSNPDKFYWLRKLVPGKIDLLIAFLLWIITVALWQSVPITPSWFLSEPTFPNFQNYPTSDARFYDVVAQNALVGEGYFFIDGPVIKRPLHALYITTLRSLAGQDYNKVVSLQILVLALFPVLIFYLSKKLYNLPSGIMAAVVIMLREANSIAIAGTITTSHVKLIMVDLPAAFTNLIFVLLTVQLLQQIERKNLLALVAGAALGFTILVRFEAFIFVFPLIIVLAILLLPKKQYRIWINNTLLFFLGIVLVILPWVWRNWKVTGMVYINSPYIPYTLIEQRFKPVVETTMPTQEAAVTIEPTISAIITPTKAIPTKINPTKIPTISTSQGISPTVTPIPKRLTVTEEAQDNAIQQAISYITANPYQLASFFLAHYLNSQLQTILIMPSSYSIMESLTGFLGHRSFSQLWEECCSVKNYVYKMPYWHKWNSKFPSQSVLPLIINSIILSTGIYVAWRRNKLIGMLPLLYCVTYLVLNSVFRNSGGRYVLPVDWIMVIYFCIGLTYISIRMISSITRISDNEYYIDSQSHFKAPSKIKSVFGSPKFYMLIIGIFLFSSTIPLVETSFPRLYTESRKKEMIKALYQSELITDPQRQDLESFLKRGGSVFAGRALYPQYYKANVGGIGDRSSDQSPRPYSRLIFYLVGRHNSSVLMPMKEKPYPFPNASDVLVYTCPEEQVLAVAVYDALEAPQAIWWNSSYPKDFYCPLPLPGTEK